jgi:hypothetical protein
MNDDSGSLLNVVLTVLMALTLVVAMAAMVI